MEKILISQCLIGDNVTYNGKNHKTPYLDKLLEYFELIPFCPEHQGGLPIPREPSERRNGEVISKSGKNVTKNYQKGAELAYNICLYFSIKVAILKEGSPSCGVHEIYNGQFENRKIYGKGVTTEYLLSKGIKVISENEIEDFIKSIEKADKEEN